MGGAASSSRCSPPSLGPSPRRSSPWSSWHCSASIRTSAPRSQPLLWPHGRRGRHRAGVQHGVPRHQGGRHQGGSHQGGSHRAARWAPRTSEGCGQSAQHCGRHHGRLGAARRPAGATRRGAHPRPDLRAGNAATAQAPGAAAVAAVVAAAVAAEAQPLRTLSTLALLVSLRPTRSLARPSLLRVALPQAQHVTPTWIVKPLPTLRGSPAVRQLDPRP